ncbi:alpha/beta hydrolase [Shewanella sp. VB17]|uniref:alpha/beta hydrolase n=1 Tax=Shewanella sp. VB17 TaxID=2739432 RepID=UPI001562FF1B|nr:alpha/beta hydrolase [Shewanella sp. VB17]NRD75579.1 alpha/beta hydrolase [Shewanella sp. VB17]
MKYLKVIAIIIACCVKIVHAENIYDESRDRSIPVEMTFPVELEKCSVNVKCPVAFLSAGYGVSHIKYTFLSKQLNQLGYLVVAIGHELPSDPPLSVSGNLYDTRSENWSRGAETLDFLKDSLSQRFDQFDFEKLMLVGHSNGGDISAWLGNEGKAYIQQIITLDHRRVPLPRDGKIKILSIRASDFPADKGVLPTASEQKAKGICIVTIPKARHNDITDFGPLWLTDNVTLIMSHYVKGHACSELIKA